LGSVRKIDATADATPLHRKLHKHAQIGFVSEFGAAADSAINNPAQNDTPSK
jgi:hypothetical protein